MLELNLVTQNSLGSWDTPLSPEIRTSSITFPRFTANLAGLYQFYVAGFLDSKEILAIQIQINTVGKFPLINIAQMMIDHIFPLLGNNFAELTSSNEYTLLSGNNIFYTDTTLVCVTSDTSVVPVWSYRETQQGNDSTPTGVWDATTGISTLDISTSQQGYYTCTMMGSPVYNVATFNLLYTQSELIGFASIVQRYNSINCVSHHTKVNRDS